MCDWNDDMIASNCTKKTTEMLYLLQASLLPVWVATPDVNVNTTSFTVKNTE
jgi:hypothetical protein